MKYTNAIVLAFCLVLTPAAYAENGWVLANSPLPYVDNDDNLLGKVQFASPALGVISIGNGRIARTNNAGTEWDIVTLSPGDTVSVFSDPARAMHFVSGSTGWIIGTLGASDRPTGAAIFKTTNYGATWDKTVLPYGKYGLSLDFIDENTGWASVCTYDSSGYSDPALLKTTNGGADWTKVSEWIGFPVFVDANTGWIVVDSVSATGETIAPHRIYKTTDGGANWTPQFESDLLTDTRIQFTDANNGWVVSGRAVYHTTNGGTDWTAVTNTGLPLSSDTKSVVFFLNANCGWIGSHHHPDGGEEYDVIAHTSDGGATWSLQSLPTNEKIFSISFSDTSNGWAVCDYNVLIRTTTGGGSASVEDCQSGTPAPFSLAQNHPNPFNPSTTISFTLAARSAISLKVFDVTGREVATLASGVYPAGEHSLVWNADGVASGVYFCKLRAGGVTEARKLVLVK